MAQIVDVAMGFDEGYLLPASVAIRSMVSHAPETVKFRVHIFHEGFSPECRAGLSLCGRRQDDVILYQVNNLKSFDDLFQHSSASYLNRSALLRLHVDELPADIARVIYLDADTLIRSDLSPLWFQDLSSFCVGAVEDEILPNRGALMRGLPGEQNDNLSVEERGRHIPSVTPKYFNSGVLLIDLNRWRKSRISERLRGLLKLLGGYLNCADRGILRILPDQDALNILLLDDWHQLSHQWNRLVPHYKFENLSESQTTSAIQGAHVLHFAGNVKPWSKNYPSCQLGAIYRTSAEALGVELDREIVRHGRGDA